MVKSILHNLVKQFKLTIANKERVDFGRGISHSAIHRLGLELAGKKPFGTHKNIIGWGTKEQNYFESIGIEEAKKLFEQAIVPNVPFVILSVGVHGEVLEAIIEAADKSKTPVLKTDMHLSLITSTIGFEIAVALSEEEERHGSLVIVNGVGVMITGKSGVGKSEAVMELIQQGHTFVSDDTVRIKRIGQTFFGYPAEITRDILEVRGVGLVDIRAIYGIQSIRNDVTIEIIIELVDVKDTNEEFDRLGNAEITESILGGYLPKMQIPIKEGRSTSSLIIVAVNSHLAKTYGNNPLAKIAERRGRDV